MNRGFQENEKNPFFQQLTEYPEFHLLPGNFFQKLIQLCYFQIGDLNQPAHFLLINLLKDFAKACNIQVVVQDIRFRIVVKPVYEIPGDAAIMGQDIYRVVGPVDALMKETLESQTSLAEIIQSLEDFKPSTLGDVLISKPSWCASKYLLEAIIYHFESDKITNDEIVRTTLVASLKKSNELKIQKLALDALGTEFRILSEAVFVKILHETLLKMAGTLQHLKEIIISARNIEHARLLKKAFAEVLHLKF